MDMQKWLDKAIELGSEYGIKVLGTIVIWIVGNWIIRKMLKVLTKSSVTDHLIDDHI